MLKTDLSAMPCPIARSLDRVGEWWSIMILRECFYGESRFDAFRKNLGIAPNMLTRRLNDLVESGLLERRRYSDKPPRDEYLLTEAGRDFRPVMLVLLAWGNQHFAPEGRTVILRDSVTGQEADPVLVDANTGIRIDRTRHFAAAGPAAGESTHLRMQRAAERRIAASTGESA
jgi:DNA-binding HxlR family transcriptional regulator